MRQSNYSSGGRNSGIATGFGVACGQAVWVLAATLGIVALLAAYEPVFSALKLAGAGYLIFLGLQEGLTGLVLVVGLGVRIASTSN